MTQLTLWNGERLRVGKVVALGRNYADHAREMGGAVPSQPMIFLKPATSVVGDGGVVEMPPHSRDVHYELELGVVIGAPARRVSADAWRDHVLGYAALLDMTARDLQLAAMKKGDPWDVAKGFDTFCPIGPVADARVVADPHALDLELKVNGEVRQSGNTRDLVFKIPQLVEYVSHIMTLERGDVIATGTPAGVGPVQAGDALAGSISGVGAVGVRVEGPTVRVPTAPS